MVEVVGQYQLTQPLFTLGSGRHLAAPEQKALKGGGQEALRTNIKA